MAGTTCFVNPSADTVGIFALSQIAFISVASCAATLLLESPSDAISSRSLNNVCTRDICEVGSVSSDGPSASSHSEVVSSPL